MRILENTVIPDSKLTQYLLVEKARNDKSKFLAQAGFTIENLGYLRSAIQDLVKNNPATIDGYNEYGTFYQVQGELRGTNNIGLAVITVWLERQPDGTI